MRILIIDDHALVRRGMALLVLESFPEAEVLEAPPGRDALLVMETTSVDAALFDVRMPTADGLGLPRETVFDVLSVTPPGVGRGRRWLPPGGRHPGRSDAGHPGRDLEHQRPLFEGGPQPVFERGAR